MSVLDDLKMIHHRDAQDALGVVAGQWQQLKFEFRVSSFEFRNCTKVVVAGMGGSALAADMFKSWPGLNLPFEVVKNYDLPDYVDAKTLLIASSYSGNTEETLAAFAQGRKRNAQIAVIASGGKLAELAGENNLPLYKIPAGLQPRMAVLYNFSALAQLFAELKFISGDKLNQLSQTADWLGKQAKKLLPDVPAKNNYAKTLAQELVGSSIAVYSGPKLFPAAYKWKINFNENAKNIAWCNQYPEFNHNEFLGWTSHPVNKPYKVVELRSNLENPGVVKRFLASEKLLSGKRPYPIVVNAEGENELQQLLWTIQLGDFASIYLALLNGINPTPVDLIEKLKAELSGS